MTQRVVVDERPQLAITASKALRVCALIVLGCAALGAWAGAQIVIHLTTPPEPKEAPC